MCVCDIILVSYEIVVKNYCPEIKLLQHVSFCQYLSCRLRTDGRSGIATPSQIFFLHSDSVLLRSSVAATLLTLFIDFPAPPACNQIGPVQRMHSMCACWPLELDRQMLSGRTANARLLRVIIDLASGPIDSSCAGIPGVVLCVSGWSACCLFLSMSSGFFSCASNVPCCVCL